ncbi:serine--tRNA ligase [Candidatus Shapirobacteria bacterium]|nr:serine--tRNA ligase [Candidatus Shapirobacteria bacterium]
MLDLNFIRENKELVKKGIKAKGYEVQIVDHVLEVDQKRRALLVKIESLRSQRNKLDRQDIDKGRQIKEELKRLEPDLKRFEQELKEFLWQIPAEDVPQGKNESENVEVKKWGEPQKLPFKVKNYQELGESLGIIDTQTAAKVSGTRFGYLKNEGVLLQQALIKFAFDFLIKEGFLPVLPPALISLDSMRGLGYMEGGGVDDMYLLEKDKLALVGTAEHALVPMHKNEILEAKKLPLRYAGFSPGFRREAGSYGKDTAGIFRVHQFDKVEMISFVKPQAKADEKEHQYLLSLEEKIVQALGVPYQITQMCTGDLGYPAARKYDLNCWFPSENRYRETHSVSTCTDFQSRRLNIKYKDGNETGFVDVLNGTAIAMGRMILAILENYQQKDGTVEIPKVLQKETGFSKITPKK